MSKKFLFAFVFALLLVALTVAVVGASTGKGAVVTLSAAQDTFTADQDVLVTVTISNPTNHSVRILKWFTPADGVEEPLFRVRTGGQSVTYTGAIYKRPAVTGNDYIMLKAGESITSVVSLGDYYNLSESGDYEIAYVAASYQLYSEKGNAFKARDALLSQPLYLKVEGRLGKRPTPTTTPTSSGNTFVACTTQQQSDLLTARTEAKNYSSGARSYLNGSLGTRYITWFGTVTTTRSQLVTDHFDKILSAFNSAPITYDCGCKQNYYAYVYPDRPYEIHLCKVFWMAPMIGTDSKAGTLIHEMSHFYVVASTDDFVYGQTGAKNLAITAPDDAVMNADNHEYFAENTPFQP